MTILKSEILSFTNSRLKRNDSDIDESIKLVLLDISSYYILDDTDTTQTLTSSDMSLDYPDDALDGEQAIKSVILTNDSGNQLEPLKPLTGGWREYNRLVEYFTEGDRSYPAYYTAFNRVLYLWPAPGQNYTTSIEYFKRHPYSADSISYSEDWRRVLYFGVTAEVAIHHKMTEQIGLWNTRYITERDRMINNSRQDVAIIE